MDREFYGLRLRSLGIQETLEEEHQLLATKRALEADLARAQGRISTWDRVLFIHLTEHEIREGELKKELRSLEGRLREVDALLEDRLGSLQQDSLELQLCGLVELCLRQARRLMGARPDARPLTRTLKRLSELVNTHFCPEVDWESLFQGLDQEPVCAQLAREAEQEGTEWPAGYPPMDAVK
ncbi:MAG: hypothetical protein AB1758_22185, partial [Candidatus Eremiobacterota bacterium]